jgi:uncharacterized membrane protein YeaQ/YmgE (transglycosylase-associated protein family)
VTARQLDTIAKLILTLIIVAGFFGTIAGIMVSVRDQTDHDILSVMAGTLGTVFANIVYSWFKKDKDEK